MHEEHKLEPKRLNTRKYVLNSYGDYVPEDYEKNHIEKNGPLLTDEVFFCECLDYTLKGLEKIPEVATKGDFVECRKIFAEYVRNSLDEKLYCSTLSKEEPLGREELIEKAELALRHVMSPCKIPYDFCGKEVDWFANPTANKYKEWTWQLNRHAELLILAKAYRETKDERYANECCNLFTSWVKQAEQPPFLGGTLARSSSLCWRTIEAGIRMSIVWPEILHLIYKSPACNDRVLTDWYKSLYEHATLLRYNHVNGSNWLIMEMSGLLHIAVLSPCLKGIKECGEYALDLLKRELEKQVYPDGFQYELSTGYQTINLIHYSKIIRMLRAYGMLAPKDFESVIQKMLHVLIKLMRPNGALPDLNDGDLASVVSTIAPYADLFPDDKFIQWAMSGGKSGIEPEEKSTVLPYAGFAIFRSGWKETDTWVCFDGAPLGVGHYHEDKLNVLLHANGKYVLTEGNNYAYDTSQMRKYVLSTRAHNTILVDNKEQNRKKTLCWSDDSIKKVSDIKTKLSDFADSARAVYDNCYGDLSEKEVVHERSVYFIKGLKELSPLVIVVDRLTSMSEKHSYDVQWHLDTDKLISDGLNLKADGLDVIVSSQTIENVKLCIEKGVKEPTWNGWTADSAVQNDYRPIYVAKHCVYGKDLRWVTVLQPTSLGNLKIINLKCSQNIEDSKIVLVLSNGNEITLNEKDLLDF